MKKLLLIMVLSLLWCNVGFAEIIHLKCERQNQTYTPPPVFMAIDFENNKVGINEKGLFSDFDRKTEENGPHRSLYRISKIDDYKIHLEGERYTEVVSANTETYGQVLGTATYLEKLIIDRTVGRVDSNWPFETIKKTGQDAIYGRDSGRELKNCEVFESGTKF